MNANKIRAALNNKRIGLTESYKNRIANAVANAVIKARKANVAVAAANLGAISEPVAAVHVNNAANKLANLNKYMNTISGYTNNKNKVNQYITTKRNLNANRALNAGRNGGPKYANFFKLVNTKKVGGNNQRPANQRPANQRPANQRPANQAPPATANNRFKNMNINTLVKSAAQTLTNENKVKLKAAIKAKMNTLNENSMNRVRLVNANRNLN
jgi:hypothetical protein